MYLVCILIYVSTVFLSGQAGLPLAAAVKCGTGVQTFPAGPAGYFLAAGLQALFANV